MRELLGRDPGFRRYQTALSIFGAGLLAFTPLLVVCLSDALQVPALWQVLVTTTLPILVVPFAVHPWARYLDAHRVLAFRAVHGRVQVVGVTLLIGAVLLHVEWLLWPGAIVMGIALAAGGLAWTLGHNDFAPHGEETRYMAVHVTLTGIRGLVAPPLAIALYHGLEAVGRGLGPYALLAPYALVLAGARQFHVLDQGRRAQAAA
jgi:hypothetical protein